MHISVGQPLRLEQQHSSRSGHEPTSNARVTVPTLMLSGRFDFFYPSGSSQEPMFRLLGTPTEHKRRIIYEAGHDIPRNALIRDSLDWLDWLDRYLGPMR